jgi:ABC-type multidrug transport system fused ATPase/permease subunit
MEPTIFRFILRYSWRQQLLLLGLTVGSFPFLYASLDLPKTIVNRAIDGKDFPKTYFGFQFDQLHYLAVLCGLFLLMVLINGGFKYVINVYKGLVGERMLRRFRYQLFSHVLRFPLPHFRRTSQGELIAMITSEVEPLGGFIGDAVALPAFQGGTLLTILVFMFVQDWVLGLAAVALYPLQMYVIPKLQRQVNQLAKERVRTVRRLSDRIGESVTAIAEIHGHDTAELHRAEFARLSGTIFDIRFRIYRKKFFIKFLNNFIAQLTPFFFFSIGGYLVIKGELSFGALVAVLAAYKDLSSPWKELLDWYQQKEDTRVKYDQLVEQFAPPGMLDPALQRPVAGEPPHLAGRIQAHALTLDDDGGLRLVDVVSFEFDLTDRVALQGDSGSGHQALARLLARLQLPTAGTLKIGDQPLADLPEAVTGRRIAYVGPEVMLIAGTIRDNLFYPLRRRPLRPASHSVPAAALERRRIEEAEKTGNTTADPAADWIDWDAAGAGGPAELLRLAIGALDEADLEPDMVALGLRLSIEAAAYPAIAAGCLQARAALRQRLDAEPALAGLVETFDPARYNRNMTLAENILFGTPIGPTFAPEQIAENRYLRSVLDRLALTEDMMAAGLRTAKIMIDLFRDLPPGHDFFDRFSFISAEQLPEIEQVVRRVETSGLLAADPADRAQLLTLPFKLVPARHRLGIFDLKTWEQRLLAARRAFALDLPVELRGAIAFFDPERYNDPSSVQDNILFGKLVYGRAAAQRTIGALIEAVIGGLDLRQPIADLGLGFEVGVGGSRLSTAQRQKLGIARALLKRPDLLVVDQALAALDATSQAAIRTRILTLAAERPMGLVWVMGVDDDTTGFGRVLRMEGGRVINQGRIPGPEARPAAADPG